MSLSPRGERLALTLAVASLLLLGPAVVRAEVPSDPEDSGSEFAFLKTPAYRQFMALVRAARRGDERRVRALIRRGVEVNGRDAHDDIAPSDRPLAAAAEKGHLGVVNLLLAAGARVDACCCSCVTALHYAIRERHADVVARLLEAGAEPTLEYDGRMSPLELARATGDARIIRLLEAALAKAPRR